jgi:hypothetical protein
MNLSHQGKAGPAPEPGGRLEAARRLDGATASRVGQDPDRARS